MTKKNKPVKDSFSLFETEEQMLENASSMVELLEDVADGVQELADAYRIGYREQKRMVRLSDRLQSDLQHTNQTLAQHTADLARLTLALHQEVTQRQTLATQLQVLNESVQEQVSQQVTKGREQELSFAQQACYGALGELLRHITRQWRGPMERLDQLMQSISQAALQGAPDGFQVQKECADSARELIGHMNDAFGNVVQVFSPDDTLQRFRVEDALDLALTIVDQSSNGLQISVERDVGADLTVLGYPNELGQVLMTVLGYIRTRRGQINLAEPGKVHIRISGDGRLAMIDLQDNVGEISQADLEGLVERTSTTARRSDPGLYMSMLIMKRMNGSMTVSNVPGGARFSLVVPCEAMP